MPDAITTAIILLATIGLYIAVYFTLVYYRLIEPDAQMVPRFCQLEEGSCQTILGTRFARLFGLPNSLLGAIYYSLVIGFITAGFEPPHLAILMVVAAWSTVIVGAYLLYSLFVVLKVPCPLCIAGHTTNFLLAILLTVKLQPFIA